MTTVVETAPSHCGAGHELGPRQVLVGWRGCVCDSARHGGHRSYQCRADGCAHITFEPPCVHLGLLAGREYGR